jgi:hypothetical protein
MKKHYFISLLVCITFLSNTLFAQKIFSEGIIKYDVYLNNDATSAGIYVISVKSGNIRREIALNNIFNNVTIFNFKSGKTYTLNIDNENKYALVLSPEELKEKNSRFLNAKITYTNNNKKISGYNCESAKVDYGNGENIDIYFSKELAPQNDAFNSMFPGLIGIPLEYQVKYGTNTLKFVSTMIDIKAIDSQIFEIPADYKIVTKAELENMK